MIVYHGSSLIVKYPDTVHSYPFLDFGKGFYVTTFESQATTWAKRKAVYQKAATGILNRYEMKEEYSGLMVKRFAPDLNEWLDFVCGCRDGQSDYQQYDVIIGKVANDKVYRVVEKYHSGDWDRERALREIRVNPNYDQIAFISQKAIEQLLTFDGYQEVAIDG